MQVLGQIYLAAFIPVNFLSLALIAIDHGERNFLFYNVLRSIPSGIYLLGLLLLYFLDSFTIATAVCASWFGTCMIVIAKVASRWRVFTTLPSLQESFAVLRQGFCFHGATLITIATTQMDRAAAMFILSDEELGLYAVAFTFASAGLSVVAHSVPTVLLPSLAGQADRAVALEQLQEGLRRTLNVLLLASAAAMGAIPAVLPILFGENFRSAVPVAVALVGAFLPLALRQVALRSLRAFRDGKTGLAVETVAFGSFALLVAPATACFGMRGLAVAYACSNVIALAALAHRMKRIYGLTYKAWFSNRSEVMADFRLIIGLARHRCG